ncbi:uracil-DNA glycosylase [Falsiroseomonas bella]|uniref:Type-5 uracil-DNA glycosylase n=1 Tax=Falsiroseomonas bella TaxID=2184016 RepID=A0A317FBC1_9PROT|nr:uracil-DNA glycosylase [Falsiroseomonas bella]PWS36391.1 uracil-DNA glycosylase [Falsiroseomonas bella]
MSETADTPGRDCPLCPRLVAYREANRAKWPEWHNAPVPCWGPKEARIMVLGLAPGVKGANRTGRPFTGDHAGRLLYATLLKYGLATGEYREDPQDGMALQGVRIVNAVRCVPPENLPTPAEITTCNRFLAAERAAMPRLKAVIALGLVAHNALLKTYRIPVARVKFAHGAMHELPDGVALADSYHVSRYNTQTGRLTTEMFEAVVQAVLARP